MQIYVFKYTHPNRGLCYDAQTASNVIAAIDLHKSMFPRGIDRQYRRKSDGQWIGFE